MGGGERLLGVGGVDARKISRQQVAAAVAVTVAFSLPAWHNLQSHKHTQNHNMFVCVCVWQQQQHTHRRTHRQAHTQACTHIYPKKYAACCLTLSLSLALYLSTDALAFSSRSSTSHPLEKKKGKPRVPATQIAVADDA